MKIRFFMVLVIILMIASCAGVGKFTPQGASIANNAITVATGLLSALDGFYDDLVDLRITNPAYTVQATRALSMADVAAVTLRSVIAGATVTNQELNVAAGQVDGAKLIYQGGK